ncbi:hypothetical protein EBB07_01865 [Paenibacillaceae bacterium]|nr:hypothetical protein EBB07_01865 [Paenibacillaceae bacterium]
MKGKTALGIALGLIGGGIVLNLLGISLWTLIGYLIPLLLITIGYAAFRNNNRQLGVILAALGAILLLLKLSKLILIAIVIGLAIWAIRIFIGKKAY